MYGDGSALPTASAELQMRFLLVVSLVLCAPACTAPSPVRSAPLPVVQVVASEQETLRVDTIPLARIPTVRGSRPCATRDGMPTVKPDSSSVPIPRATPGPDVVPMPNACAAADSPR